MDTLKLRETFLRQLFSSSVLQSKRSTSSYNHVIELLSSQLRFRLREYTFLSTKKWFISSLVLDNLTFKKLLELQANSEETLDKLYIETVTYSNVSNGVH